MKKPILSLSQVTKTYTRGALRHTALKNIDLCVAPSEFVAVIGRSGSGKSTLLNLIAGLDQPTSGMVQIGELDLNRCSEDELAMFRGVNVGFVFQFFQLIPTLTVKENLLLAMDFVGKIPPSQRKARAAELLSLVDISEHSNKLPVNLSGGEQQRAAIARALANEPKVLLADEPTGNLDSATAASVLGLFERLVEQDCTVVVVTHDESVASLANRIIRLNDGAIVEDSLYGALR